MRVLVFDGPHQLRVEERELPTPDAGEVRLRITRIGICGSDLHGYTGASGRRTPGMVMGHEASGIVDAIGPHVEGLNLGQAVTFIPSLACDGSCGHRTVNTCRELRVVGVTPTLQGAFADHLVVGAERVVPVGGLSPELAAAAEPFAVGLHAVERAGVEPDDRVLVLGAGMIGLCVAVAARRAGAAEVVVSDPLPSRRQLATAVGAMGVDPDEVSGLGTFERSVDAVGIGATAAAALHALPPGGTACFVGLGRAEIPVPLFEIVARERTVTGAFAYPDETFRAAVDMLCDGSVDLAPLLGRVVDFEDAPAAFAGLADGSITDAKVTVSTSGDGMRAGDVA